MIEASTGPWSFGWDQLIGIANLVAIGFGLWLGKSTIDKFIDERVANRQVELAEEVLTIFYDAQNAFRDVRSRFRPGYEGLSRKPHENETAEEKERRRNNYVPIERLESYENLWNRVTRERTKAKVFFDDEVHESLNDLISIHNKIRSAAREIYQYNEEKAKHGITNFPPDTEAAYREWLATVLHDDNDEIDKEVSELVATVESKLLHLFKNKQKREK